MAKRELRLRRADACIVCHAQLDVGTVAVWDGEQKTVTCLSVSRWGKALRPRLVAPGDELTFPGAGRSGSDQFTRG